MRSPQVRKLLGSLSMFSESGQNQPVQSIAHEYFDYLGTHLPQQCAGDEFYFLPRSEEAVAHLDLLDDLREEKIETLLHHVRKLLGRLPAQPREDLEEEIDRLTVKRSMERFLWEFGDARVWRTDPTLYIKIPLFAVDDIMSRKTDSLDRKRAAMASVLSRIPQFLVQGLTNLRLPPVNALLVGRDMAHNALAFFQNDVPVFLTESFANATDLFAQHKKVIESWALFSRGLEAMEPEHSFCLGKNGLSTLFRHCLGYPGSPDKVLEFAKAAFAATEEKIVRLAHRIDPAKSWQSIAHDVKSKENSSGNILELYRREVRNLREFFRSHDVMTFPSPEEVQVLPTPAYLSSLRATASYRASLTGRPTGGGIFYITSATGTSSLVEAHSPYLSAHETYPGHHVLDTVRIHHPNPIRRQIESPLFYEGWASYAETLLDDLGYVTEPRVRLVQLQRQLWRDVRSILDVKLHTGAITIKDAAGEIERIGFPAPAAEKQLRRFALTPGYQSCYFLGMRELQRLRDRFSSHLGLKTFHDTVLQGGQITFDLVEKRLEAACAGNTNKRS